MERPHLQAGGGGVFVWKVVKSRREGRCWLPPLLTAGKRVFGALLCHLTAGRGVRAAFGCGKFAHGCHRTANPAIWAAVSGEAADKTRYAAGCGREAGKVPQTKTATSAKRFMEQDWRRTVGDMMILDSEMVE